jgi:hypothetical protein
MVDGDWPTDRDGSDPPLTRAIGDPVWDDWQTPLSAPTIPVLHLDGFDGPMVSLLDLAERQRIDLGRMSVLVLAEQFVAAVERLGDQVARERKADWLVMATRLLRSRLLFPASPDSRCTKCGSASISVQTLALQWHHPGAEQINAGAAIHSPLERLQPVDLSFRLTVAPGFQHGIANGIDVLP